MLFLGFFHGSIDMWDWKCMGRKYSLNRNLDCNYRHASVFCSSWFSLVTMWTLRAICAHTIRHYLRQTRVERLLQQRVPIYMLFFKFSEKPYEIKVKTVRNSFIFLLKINPLASISYICAYILKHWSECCYKIKRIPNFSWAHGSKWNLTQNVVWLIHSMEETTSKFNWSTIRTPLVD